MAEVMEPCLEVRVTASSLDEAERIISEVIARRLAAAVQIISPMTSVYWWRNEVHRAEEWLLLMKTTSQHFEALAACVRALHSYEVPEIIGVPITAGTPDYLEWIRQETSPESGE
ncbi:divalent-cation tolerance protein CutA [Nonomuraea sp. NPDC050310]|uniref:divalent-cation tolerance protein CutA n=1 Tax=Nonomuraea sp. NPDC050310 TaxID=3154935 RepID=UPI0033C06EC7